MRLCSSRTNHQRGTCACCLDPASSSSPSRAMTSKGTPTGVGRRSACVPIRPSSVLSGEGFRSCLNRQHRLRVPDRPPQVVARSRAALRSPRVRQLARRRERRSARPRSPRGRHRRRSATRASCAPRFAGGAAGEESLERAARDISAATDRDRLEVARVPGAGHKMPVFPDDPRHRRRAQQLKIAWWRRGSFRHDTGRNVPRRQAP